MKFKEITVTAKESFADVSVTIELEEGDDEEREFEKAERFIAARLKLMGDRRDFSEKARLGLLALEGEELRKRILDISGYKNPVASTHTHASPGISSPEPLTLKTYSDMVKKSAEIFLGIKK